MNGRVAQHHNIKLNAWEVFHFKYSVVLLVGTHNFN